MYNYRNHKYFDSEKLWKYRWRF